ncbi:hypothetical protein FRC18_001871 [Serendipita sp. 400]|nr:hypothetical protein FRC18_001871 [Serendipita sp. 400]
MPPKTKLLDKVLTLHRRKVPENQIIQPLKEGNVKLTVAQTLSIRLGQPITATPSALWGVSARRNKTSPPIKMREATNAERAYAFMHLPKPSERPTPPTNLRIVDVETWDRRLFKRMSPWVRKKVKETYLAEK